MTKSIAHPSDVSPSRCRRSVVFSKQQRTRIFGRACNEVQMLECIIVQSEKTYTLARNEFQVLMCHHAVRKDTHAGLQRILRHAMNYGCGSAIGCNEWRLLIRHRAVRKDTHVGLQRILLRAMTHGCGSAIGCNEWHNPTSDATAVAKKKKRNSNTSVELLPAASHVCLSIYLSMNLYVCLSINFSIHLSS